MHRSRLTAALLDVPDDSFEAEVTFWSGALGRPAQCDEADLDYAQLRGLASGVSVMVQRIGGGSGARLHLDIETDDIEAEVRRLEALGAVRVAQISSWWVMRDPAGLLFCVVRVQQPEAFAAGAIRWDHDGNDDGDETGSDPE
jgi:hypothetical protein